MMNERDLLIALDSLPGLGPARIRALRERFGSAAALYRAGAEAWERAGLSPDLREALLRGPDAALVETQCRAARDHGALILGLDDPAYPSGLRALHDPPPVLYVKGDLRPADAAGVALVGTRHPTAYGLEVTALFAGDLARAGVTVVSGLALGIDAAAHRAALDAGGRTVAVLGSGLDCPSPPSNRKLCGAIPAAGAVVSEFPFGVEPEPHHFPRRNRIIAGLSRAVAVIEAADRSGALITAQHALEMGREVFAVPGPILGGKSAGANRLIRDGAHPLLSIPELLERLGCVSPGYKAAAPLPAPPALSLTPDEGRIVRLITVFPTPLDEIARQARLAPSSLHPVLLSLELKGAIRQMPGMNYARNP